jgi:hypothetical protein
LQDGQPLEMRIVWPWLDKKKPTDYENKPLAPEDQSFEATFFVPKTAATPWECRNYQALVARQMEVIAPLWGTWKGYANGRDKTYWPITDCDLTSPIPPQDGFPMPNSVSAEFLEKYPWAKNHWRFRATALNMPRVSDQNNNEMKRNERNELLGLKGGDYVYASINMWGYGKGAGGVGYGFEGIKKVRDGDPVGGGGGRSIEQMFGAPSGPPVNYGQTAPVAAPALPPGYGAPAAPPAPAYAVPPTPGAPAGYPTAGGAPGAYAPPAASPSVMAPPMTYAAPPAAPMTGAYPSNLPPPPAQAYGVPSAAPAYGAPPPGQPVAPPTYGTR